MPTVNLPLPKCDLGYTQEQLEEIVPAYGRTMADLWKFMEGQTMSLCEGRKYNYETKTYEESCGGIAHGGIVYPHDLRRFLARLPVID